MARHLGRCLWVTWREENRNFAVQHDVEQSLYSITTTKRKMINKVINIIN
ncbi:hypothetical protein ACFLXG_03030 [Chloroflexota bacterium]